jgi:lysophospholipase L1-like esterase
MFDESYYQPDRFHLNEKGARVFSAKLANLLAEELPRTEYRRAMAQ